MKVLLPLLLTFLSTFAYSQEEVSFVASDSLIVTADLYLSAYNKPFIIMFHQAESSRGEYISIAPKFKNLGYNCLVVDLRSGKKSNYIKNKTAERAKKSGISARYIDAKKDMVAAIKYVKKYNEKPVILFGSSYSASLSLVLGSNNEAVSALVAFSPGEYFRPDIEIKNEISNIDIPVFLASTDLEYKYMLELVSEIPDSNKTIFKAKSDKGVHGAKALWEDSPESRECWFQLTNFFRKLDN